MQGAGMHDCQCHVRSAMEDDTGRSSRQRASVEEHNISQLDAGGGFITAHPVERDTPRAQQPLHLTTRAKARCCQVAVDPDSAGHDGLGRLFGGLVNRRMTAGGDERWPSTAFDRVAGNDAAGNI